MKVKELIERLIKCDPEGEVTFAHELDNPLYGTSAFNVLEIKNLTSDGLIPTVVIRG